MRGVNKPYLPALLLALLLAACGGKSESELLASAKGYLDKRDHKAAVIELKNLIDKNPSSAEGRFLLGQALLEGGDAVGAEVELRRAADQDFPAGRVAPLRARALLAQGQARRVIEDYGNTRLPDPMQDIELQTHIAMAHATLRSAEEARAAVDRALAISAHYGPAVALSARLKAAGGDIDGALADLEALLAKAPADVDALQLKAELLWQAKGEREAAAEQYRKALETRADLPDAHAALISLALARRDNDAAAQQLEALKKIRAGHPQTRFLEAQLAYAKGEHKQARELLQGLLRGSPDNVRALALAGAVELQLGDLPQAEAMAGRAVQAAPNVVEPRRLLAEVYLRQREPAKALAALRPMLEANVANAPVLALAAQAHLANGDAKTAQALFAKAAQIKPDDKRLSAAVALTRLGGANSDAAFDDLQRIAASDEGRAVDMALISARLQRREFDAALKAIDALEKKQADSPVPAQLRGRVHLARQDVTAAVAAFEQALAKDPKYLPAVAGLAAVDMQRKQPEAAQARFDAVLKRDPKNVQALLALAELKQAAGAGAAEVGKLHADAVAANPSDAQARQVQIDHLARLGDRKGALAAAQAAVAALPNRVELLDRLGRAQLASDDRQQALRTYGQVTALRPDSAIGYLGLASTHFAGKDYDAAARDARRALEKDPESVPAHRLAISVALRQQKPQDALALARQLQQRRPDDAAGFLGEGEIEASQKRWDAAIAAFRKATTKNEASFAATRVHLTLGAAQRGAEASRFADSWLKEHPKDTQFLFYLGDIALGGNNLAQAEAHYREVLKHQPDHALALNNVAWLVMRQNKPGALDFAERAVKVAPGQPALMDTLAMVLAAERQFPRAIELQKQVVAQAAGIPGFRMNLARIYLDAGDKKSARAELEALARLGKDFPAQDEVARLLKQAEGS